VQPAILIFEEAGEILEAHSIAALFSSIKQVIMIGDYKQLRPKLERFKLTQESKQGFDFNVSLFEQIIKRKRNHSFLVEQHRMRPSISK